MEIAKLVQARGRRIWEFSYRVFLINPGVTGDISKFEVISGWGITSSTGHAGREEYWGPIETTKEDWKWLRPVSVVKEGLA